MKAGLEPDLKVTPLEDRALIALQGPKAEEALATLTPNCAAMRFMDVADHDLNGANAWISRSGYTGEDGFEISVPADQAEKLCRDLLALDSVQAIGLGARDSLRLEAGLCLYGHDIDTATTPAEAALKWAIQKVRRSGGARGGGFPGADSVLQDPKRLRIGLLPVGRAPMREGTQLFTDQHGGDPVGQITSGGFGPTLGAPVAMGYVETQHAAPETRLYGEVRGKRLPAIVTALPFVPARFKR